MFQLERPERYIDEPPYADSGRLVFLAMFALGILSYSDFARDYRENLHKTAPGLPAPVTGTVEHTG